MSSEGEVSEHARKIAKALMEGKYGAMDDTGVEFDSDLSPEELGYGGVGVAAFVKMHRNTLFIVLGVTAIAAAGGGYYYWKKKQEEEKKKAK